MVNLPEFQVFINPKNILEVFIFKFKVFNIKIKKSFILYFKFLFSIKFSLKNLIVFYLLNS